MLFGLWVSLFLFLSFLGTVVHVVVGEGETPCSGRCGYGLLFCPARRTPEVGETGGLVVKLVVKLVVEEDGEKELSRGERVVSERKAERCIIAVECVCVCGYGLCTGSPGRMVHITEDRKEFFEGSLLRGSQRGGNRRGKKETAIRGRKLAARTCRHL
jgi:hypothetical protein